MQTGLLAVAIGLVGPVVPSEEKKVIKINLFTNNRRSGA
jgi:hypothetical protein